MPDFEEIKVKVLSLPLELGGSSDLLPKKSVYLSAQGTVLVSTATTGSIGFVMEKPVPSAKAEAGHLSAGTQDDGSWDYGDTLDVIQIGVMRLKAEASSIAADKWLVVGANGYVQEWTDPSQQVIGKSLEACSSSGDVWVAVNVLNPPASTELFSVQTLSADGAVTFTKVDNVCEITKSSACAATLAAPTTAEAGYTVIVKSESAYEHTVALAGGTTYTMPAVVGATLMFRAKGTSWVLENAYPEYVQQSLSADGAITYAGTTQKLFKCHITKGSAAAATLTAPTAADIGKTLTIIDQTGYQHGITVAAPGFNANSAYTVYTFTGAKGDSITLEVMNAATPYWAISAKTRTWVSQALTADGAIAVKPGYVSLTKAGVLAATIADPGWCNDGDILVIISHSAQAMTVTNTTGFNGLGSGQDVATYGGAIGDGFSIIADKTIWRVLGVKNVTVA